MEKSKSNIKKYLTLMEENSLDSTRIVDTELECIRSLIKMSTWATGRKISSRDRATMSTAMVKDI